MARSKRQQELIVSERQARVADLYLRGKTMREIGEAVGVSHMTVVRDLAELHERWLERADDAVKKRAAVELARIDHLEDVAWAAFERSCQPATIRTSKITKGRTAMETSSTGSKDNKVTVKKVVPLPNLEVGGLTEKGQSGDPRFLERVSWCIQKRCELMGILQPEMGGITTVTTVVNKVDLAVVLGQEKGIPVERIGSVSPN